MYEVTIINQDERAVVLRVLLNKPEYKVFVMSVDAWMMSGEPIFLIRAQDITAPSIVHLWSDANQYLRENMERGVSQKETLRVIEERLSNVFQDLGEEKRTDDKIMGARRIAVKMDEWTGTKKIAD